MIGDITMQFHERIKQLREQKGWTQNTISSILGISKSTYIKYERGEREPRYGTLVALSELFQVSVDFLLGKSDIDNIYKERIDMIFSHITADEFKAKYDFSEDSMNKLIADYLSILYLENNDPTLDLLYLITKIKCSLMALYRKGLHIFCYDTWATEDKEFKEVVDPPNSNDLTEFILQAQDVRLLLEDYIKSLSSKDYFFSSQLKYEKEIAEYASINLAELVTKFRNDFRYKLK